MSVLYSVIICHLFREKEKDTAFLRVLYAGGFKFRRIKRQSPSAEAAGIRRCTIIIKYPKGRSRLKISAGANENIRA